MLPYPRERTLLSNGLSQRRNVKAAIDLPQHILQASHVERGEGGVGVQRQRQCDGERFSAFHGVDQWLWIADREHLPAAGMGGASVSDGKRSRVVALTEKINAEIAAEHAA